MEKIRTPAAIDLSLILREIIYVTYILIVNNVAGINAEL